jgi:putative transposase
MWLEEQDLDAAFLIHDRDTKFAAGFRDIFASDEIRCLKTPKLAPDANAYAEAWIGALKRECLDHFLCFSRDHLDHINQEYARFYNVHRPHQGRGNWTLPAARAGPNDRDHARDAVLGDRVRCRRLLGGLLRHDYREAA